MRAKKLRWSRLAGLVLGAAVLLTVAACTPITSVDPSATDSTASDPRGRQLQAAAATLGLSLEDQISVVTPNGWSESIAVSNVRGLDKLDLADVLGGGQPLALVHLPEVKGTSLSVPRGTYVIVRNEQALTTWLVNTDVWPAFAKRGLATVGPPDTDMIVSPDIVLAKGLKEGLAAIDTVVKWLTGNPEKKAGCQVKVETTTTSSGSGSATSKTTASCTTT